MDDPLDTWNASAVRWLLALLLACGGRSSGPAATSTASAPQETPLRWSERFGPQAGHVVIGGTLLLDCDAQVDSILVRRGGVLVFEPDRSVTLKVAGNVEIRGGRLVMRPASTDRIHTLHFHRIGPETELPESQGSMHVEPHPGLWITSGGVWDARGTPRTPWKRGEVSDPTWRPDDVLGIAPTGPASGGRGGTNWHPTRVAVRDAQPPPDESGWPSAEVANLTRNVVVMGESATRRTHVMILGPRCAPQRIEYVAIRHASPADFLGRYGLHWHHCRDTSRGTIARGVVVETSGDHAFVPHGSHGITIEDSIAFESGRGAAFWWDPEESHRTYPSNASHDNSWRHNLVLGFSDRAFSFGQGEGNVALDNAAAGSDATRVAAGFDWDGLMNQMPNTWEFRGNTAHNIRGACLRAWQNDRNTPLIEELVAWHCGSMGMLVGAYRNSFHYRDIRLGMDGGVGIVISAMSPPANQGIPLRIEDVHVIGAEVGITVVAHNRPPGQRLLVRNVAFERLTGTPVKYDERVHQPSLIDYVGVTLDGVDLRQEHFDVSGARPQSELRYETRDGTAWRWTRGGDWERLPDHAVTQDWLGAELPPPTHRRPQSEQDQGEGR